MGKSWLLSNCSIGFYDWHNHCKSPAAFANAEAISVVCCHFNLRIGPNGRRYFGGERGFKRHDHRSFVIGGLRPTPTISTIGRATVYVNYDDGQHSRAW